MYKILFIIMALFMSCMSPTIAPSCDKQLNSIIRELAKESKQKGLILALSGGGTNPDRIRMISAWFNTYESLTVAIGRSAIIELSETLTKIIKSKEAYTACFPSGPPYFSAYDLAIFGSKPNIKTEDSISLVSMNGDVLVYKNSDTSEEGLSEIILKETYEDALERLNANQTQDPKSIEGSVSSLPK